jgi:hypothetical protein
MILIFFYFKMINKYRNLGSYLIICIQDYYYYLWAGNIGGIRNWTWRKDDSNLDRKNSRSVVYSKVVIRCGKMWPDLKNLSGFESDLIWFFYKVKLIRIRSEMIWNPRLPEIRVSETRLDPNPDDPKPEMTRYEMIINPTRPEPETTRNQKDLKPDPTQTRNPRWPEIRWPETRLDSTQF